MTDIRNIISIIKNKNINSRLDNFKIYINNFFTNWFIKLNKNDLEILSEICFFLIIRIKNLFNINEKDLLFQFSKNNNQDIKALTLLFLPYLNDEETKLYDNITNLNQIICSQKLKNDVLEYERTQIIKDHFKYSTMGLSFISDEGKIEDDIIYKVIYNKLISLINTLSIINGKFYINWINITPLTLDTYKSSYIYKQTSNDINNTINNYLNGVNSLDYNGLYIGEFYNVYRNIYYEDIKKIKWIIFTYFFNDQKIYLLQYLHSILDINKIIQNTSFNDLNIEDKIKFTNGLKNINLSTTEYLIWKNFIVFFVNNYTHKLLLFNDNIKNLKNIFTIETVDLDIETGTNDFSNKTQTKINNILDEDILLFLKNVNPEYMWEYLKETLTIFENTVYYDHLIKDNKILTNFVNYNGLNLKNIYNIAKSIVHYTNGNNWLVFPEKFDALTFNNKSIFFNRFLNPNTTWINLRNNLNIENGRRISNFDYNNQINQILNSWSNIKYDLVWEYLVKNGILNEFNVDYRLTDKYNSANVSKELKDKIKKNKEWQNAYYFINNKKFSELKNILIKKSDYQIEEKKYFDYLTDTLKWYSFYAMDWISQINFFNHYLNHRVLFVTGATGQGKSTQVPKLLLYAIKMLDYKTKGKLVCTQPRINVTVGNSEWIAQEMGIPIKKPHLKLGKVKTDNFYLQYKYSDDNHIKKICSHLTLKLSTDGSLFEELIDNTLLKEKVYTKNKEAFTYGFNNNYDIVIIDESHEHNVYMDLLTTIIRSSIYYNNDVKFIIMSATLEEDEPIYRQYFKCINDNLEYPITQLYLDPFKRNNFIQIDRNYLDRRFHISPPGQTTQYRIIEKYLEYPIINKNKSDELNSTITLEKSFETIKQICAETQKGDILLFANGMKDIKTAVKYLNTVLPEGNVTLPYLSEINDRYKDIIINIEKTIGFIKNKRSNINDIWTSGDYVEENVPSGIYKRAIIVATNVAEASLTLPSLRYVVETGYTKTNVYDDKLDTYNFRIEQISEASRKQRKGRVGRTAEGTVYYIYEKGSREQIKPKFKISQINYEDTFLKLIKKDKEYKKNINTNEEITAGIVIPNKFDPNTDEFYVNINNPYSNKNKTFKNIADILFRQYSYGDNSLIKLLGKTKLDFIARYYDGFIINNLLDLEGKFYLIHPFELLIKRNILNNIIYFNDKKKDKLEEKIFYNMIVNLKNKMLLVDLSTIKINKKTRELNFNNLFVCEIYEYITIIRRNLNFIDTDKDAIVMLASMGFNCFNEVLEILTLIKEINGSMQNLLNKIDNNYNNTDREIEYLYDIINSFKLKFNFLSIFKIESYEYLYKKYYGLFEKLCAKFKTCYLNNSDEIPLDIDKEIWDILLVNYKNGLLVSKNCFEQILNTDLIINEIFSDINVNTAQILIWCQQNNIKYNIFINFLHNYIKNKLDVLTINKNDDDKYEEPNIFEIMKIYSSSFLKTVRSNLIYERIVRSFLFGYPFQVGFKIYQSIFHTGVGKASVTKLINADTLINKDPYIFYYGFDKATDYFFSKNKLPPDNLTLTMKITNRIKLEWLCTTLPLVYNPTEAKQLYLYYDDDNKFYIKEINTSLYQTICANIKNKWSSSMILFDNATLNNSPVLYTYIKMIKTI